MALGCGSWGMECLLNSSCISGWPRSRDDSANHQPCRGTLDRLRHSYLLVAQLLFRVVTHHDKDDSRARDGYR